MGFNESTINYIDIKNDTVEMLLDCISMNAENKFPDDNRLKILFADYGRIAVSYRKGNWDDENAEVVKIQPKDLKSKFYGLKLDSMYGWEFLNLGKKQYKEWSDRKSLNKINDSNWSSMNTIDLFAEQIGKEEIIIDIRIWFKDFQIFDLKNNEITKEDFANNAERGWNQLNKTGITTTDHKTKIL